MKKCLIICILQSKSSLKNFNKILLLGGTGFFGKSFLDYFQRILIPINPKVKLILASRHTDDILGLINPVYFEKNIFIQKIDVVSCKSLPTCDLVIHAASSTNEDDYRKDPSYQIDNIVKGAENVIKLIKKETIFMYVSSGAIYGVQNNIKGFPENSVINNHYDDDVKSPYSKGKIIAEKAIMKYAIENSINSLICRCFAFIGRYLPFETHFAIGNLLNSIIKKNDFYLKADKLVYRTYMYADDLVESLMLACQYANTSVPIFNIGSDEVVELHELSKELSKEYKFNVIENGINHSKNSDIYIPDITNILSKGFKPRYNIRKAIKEVIKLA